MAGLSHVGTGFAAKWLAPELPVGFLVLASEVPDIAWLLFWLLKVEPWGSISYWTHGLLSSALWSLAAALITLAAMKKARPALIVGLLSFGHWIIDFITHPMGAVAPGVSTKPDLPLLFKGSPLVGLGLYNRSYALAMSVEIGVTALGLGLYILWLVKGKRPSAIGKEGTI